MMSKLSELLKSHTTSSSVGLLWRHVAVGNSIFKQILTSIFYMKVPMVKLYANGSSAIFGLHNNTTLYPPDVQL